MSAEEDDDGGGEDIFAGGGDELNDDPMLDAGPAEEAEPVRDDRLTTRPHLLEQVANALDSHMPRDLWLLVAAFCPTVYWVDHSYTYKRPTDGWYLRSNCRQQHTTWISIDRV